MNIPITRHFSQDNDDLIGNAWIDQSKLPPGIKYSFQPGFQVLKFHLDENGGEVVDEAELLEISLVLDKKSVRDDTR